MYMCIYITAILLGTDHILAVGTYMYVYHTLTVCNMTPLYTVYIVVWDMFIPCD